MAENFVDNTGFGNWSPYTAHVQGGLKEGNFLNGQFILICAGPPFFNQLNLSGQNVPVFPIGLTQNVALSQNKAISRIFEIGSDRSYFISGRSVGQLSLGRVVYHGPSLLRALYAYYDTADEGFEQGAFGVKPLVAGAGGINPFTEGTESTTHSGLHDVKVPPGYDNMFMNLASDLFSQPLGLMLIFKDNQENTVSTVYLDQCYVPQHSIAVDAQGLIIQESVGIQYEKMVPVKSINVTTIDGILADDFGGYANAGSNL
tara:strand:- start:5345 stop:6121 length:777 start_codon:yes stop_codon:yes gene_type:complete